MGKEKNHLLAATNRMKLLDFPFIVQGKDAAPRMSMIRLVSCFFFVATCLKTKNTAEEKKGGKSAGLKSEVPINTCILVPLLSFLYFPSFEINFCRKRHLFSGLSDRHYYAE